MIGLMSILAALPVPNAQGDYVPPVRRTPVHRLWRVVDRDPAGLNCRMAPNFSRGTQWFDTPRGEALLVGDRHAIGQWPAVTTLKKGTIVQAFTTSLGAQIIIRDRRGKPWLPVVVEEPQTNVHCFLRANSRFIQPAGKEIRL
jgi:hypothetical protein